MRKAPRAPVRRSWIGRGSALSKSSRDWASSVRGNRGERKLGGGGEARYRT